MTDTLAIASLQDALIDVAELASQAKQAHWNVRGAAFLPVHQWLDELATLLMGHTDALAERIAALGGWPDACSETLSERNTLESLPFGRLTTGEALAAMDAGLGRIASLAGTWLNQPSLNHDPATADLFTGLARDVATQRWLAGAQQ